MKNHRMITLAGAGSALAATIAFAALLFVPSSGTTVEAATIFASFRDAVTNAFTISLEDVGDDGIRVNGKLAVVFDEEISGGLDGEDRVRGLHAAFHVEADEDAAEAAGLDILVDAAFTEESQWVYLKTNRLPRELLQNPPAAAFLQTMSGNGLLLDVTGLIEEFDAANGGLFDLSDLGITADAGAGASASGDLKTDLNAELERQADSEDDAAEQLLGNLLTGKATVDDLQQLATLIEEAAGEVSVTPQDDGSYLLTASGFRAHEMGMPNEDQAMLERVELKMAYREAVGLLWAEVAHVGAYDGTVRFETTEITRDDPRFSSQRYREDGKTQFFDLAAFKGLIETMGGVEVSAGTD